MFNKPFFIFLFLMIISQVFFSFFYSSEIINQNNLINKNQTVLQSLKDERQELEKEFSSLASLNQIQKMADQNYINLEESSNLQN